MIGAICMQCFVSCDTFNLHLIKGAPHLILPVPKTICKCTSIIVVGTTNYRIPVCSRITTIVINKMNNIKV